MNFASVALVVAALGVSFGWQPSDDDPQAYEVLMQVEPELVDVLHSNLQSGRQIPIESHVPASVTPIRNIRIVVGTDELPRTPIAPNSDAKTQAGRIVRGQEESPIEHTARFQSDDGWSGDRYAPTTTGDNRQFDQRGVTIGVEPIRTAQASPWTLDGAQQAATDAGNSLRNSVNSGVQQTTQQFSQGGQPLIDGAQSAGRDAQSAGRDFGQQLQNMSGFGSQSSPPSSASSSASRTSKTTWPAPPPLATSPQSISAQSSGPQASAPVNRTTTPAAWSGIQPQLAPPRLLTPRMTNTPRVASNPSAGRTSSGPSFPEPPISAAPPLHSVLTDPATADQRATEPDWSSVWGTGATSNTASSDNDSGVGLEPVPPRPRTATTNTQPPAADPNAARFGWPTSPSTPATVTANSNSATPPIDDRYGQSSAATPAANNGANAWANFGQPEAKPFNNAPPQMQPPAAAAAQNQPIVQQSPSSQPTIGMQPPATHQPQQPANAEEVPWKPLLGAMLALAGSLGANVYLGMSYAEARHRYRTLVAKTTHSFQKAAGIAA